MFWPHSAPVDLLSLEVWVETLTQHCRPSARPWAACNQPRGWQDAGSQEAGRAGLHEPWYQPASLLQFIYEDHTSRWLHAHLRHINFWSLHNQLFTLLCCVCWLTLIRWLKYYYGRLKVIHIVIWYVCFGFTHLLRCATVNSTVVIDGC